MLARGHTAAGGDEKGFERCPDYVDHSISTLAVKAKSNLADCNIRIHSNPPSSLALLLQPLYETAGFHALVSLGAIPLRLFFALAPFLLSRSVLFRRWRSLPPRVVQTLFDSILESSSRRVNFVRGLVTIEPRRSEIRTK